ncbi:MAG: DNA-3-methyladenine glycosylase I [Gemmatimonadota bacterium]
MNAAPKRCGWQGSDPEMIAYHDTEWGVPVHDDARHFEFLVLDAFQAGLSWAIILRKRTGFRAAFANFDPTAVALYGPADVERLRADASIVRNRQKIEATISNAREFLAIQSEFGSFDEYIWRFVDGRTIRNRWKSPSDMPAKTAESEAMSHALRARGFGFVGPTICYAYMQAAGMVNDHTVDCFRHSELEGALKK